MAGTRMPQNYKKYAAVEEMVASGASVRSICQTLKVDSRTVLKYFPAAGGLKGGETVNCLRQTPKSLNSLAGWLPMVQA